MYRDVKKKLLSVALCICMIIGAVQVVPRVKAAASPVTISGTNELAVKQDYTINYINDGFTYDGKGIRRDGKIEGISLTSVLPKDGGDPITCRLVFKQGDVTVDNPTNAGTYDVYLEDVAGKVQFSQKIGTYVIKKATIAEVAFVANRQSYVLITDEQGAKPSLDYHQIETESGATIELEEGADKDYTISLVKESGLNQTCDINFTSDFKANFDNLGKLDNVTVTCKAAYYIGGNYKYDIRFVSGKNSHAYDGIPTTPAVAIYDKSTSIKKYDIDNGAMLFTKSGSSGAADTTVRDAGSYVAEINWGSSGKQYGTDIFAGTFSTTYQVTGKGVDDLCVFVNGYCVNPNHNDDPDHYRTLVMDRTGESVIPAIEEVQVRNGGSVAYGKPTFENNVEVGTAYMNIPISTNVYQGTLRVPFYIVSELRFYSVTFQGRTFRGDEIQNIKLPYSGRVRVPQELKVVNKHKEDGTITDADFLTENTYYKVFYSYEISRNGLGEPVFSDSIKLTKAEADSSDEMKKPGYKKIIIEGLNTYDKQGFELLYEVLPVQMEENRASFQVTVSPSSIFYNGEIQKPDAIVSYTNDQGDKISLTKGVDFDLAYPTDRTNVDVGNETAKVTIVPKDGLGFEGSLTKTFSIYAVNLSDARIENAPFTYSGNPVAPQIVIDDPKYGAGYRLELKRGEDYQIVDAEGNEINGFVFPTEASDEDYHLYIKNLHDKNITGNIKDLTYRINRKPINECGFRLTRVQGDDRGIEWNGGETKPEIETSVNSDEYKVSYAGLDQIGVTSGASVTITAKEKNYTGSLTLNYTILRRNLKSSPCDFTTEVTGNVSSGYKVQLHVEDPAIVSASALLTKGVDYKVDSVFYCDGTSENYVKLDSLEYDDNLDGSITVKKAGKYKITIKGNGTGDANARYSDDSTSTLTTEFTCGTDLSIDGYYVATTSFATDFSEVYDGNVITPSAFTLRKSTGLKETDDADSFTVQYLKQSKENPGEYEYVEAPKTTGTYYLVATGNPEKGYYGTTLRSTKYTDEYSAWYQITAPVWNATNPVSIELVSTGAIKYDPSGTSRPTVIVRYNGNELKSGSDYEIIWPEDKAGINRITIIGKGNYEYNNGTIKNEATAAYNVQPIDITSGADEKVTVETPPLAFGVDDVGFKIYYNNKELDPEKSYTYQVSGSAIKDGNTFKTTYIVRGKEPNFKGTREIQVEVYRNAISTVTEVDGTDALEGKDPGFYVVWDQDEMVLSNTHVVDGINVYDQVKPKKFKLYYKKSNNSIITLNKSVTDNPNDPDADYYIADYGSNNVAGTHENNKVKIVGINHYDGGVELKFCLYTDINKAQTTDTSLIKRSATPSAITKKQWNEAVSGGNAGSLIELSDSQDGGNIDPSEYTLIWDQRLNSDATKLDPEATNDYVVRVVGAKSGKHYYCKEFTMYFSIVDDFREVEVVTEKIYYNGSAATLGRNDLSVKLGNVDLTLGVDYKILEDTYKDNTSLGTASVMLEGMGTYEGKKTITFDIVCPYDKLVIFVKEENGQFVNAREKSLTYTYTGQNITPAVQVYCSYDIPEGVDIKDYDAVSSSASAIKSDSIYRVEYGQNNTSAGERTGLISITGDYFTGLVWNKLFSISAASICPFSGGGSVFYSPDEKTITYKGRPFTKEELAIELRYKGIELNQDNRMDYTIQGIEKTLDSGERKIYFNGVQNFKDTYEYTVHVLKQSIKDQNEIKLKDDAQEIQLVYSGNSIDEMVKEKLQLIHGGYRSLVLGTDYTIVGYFFDERCSDNNQIRDDQLNPIAPTAQGTYYVKLKGLNNYTEERVIPVVVGKREMSDTSGFKITFATSADCPLDETGKPACVYNGSAHTPDIIVTYGRKELEKGVDYSVVYNNNTNASTEEEKASVTVTALDNSNYDGSVTETFVIRPKNIAQLSTGANTMVYSSIAENYPFTGEAVKPPMVIQDLETNATLREDPSTTDDLTPNTDYRITYESEYRALEVEKGAPSPSYGGKVTITITGQGNYTGTQQFYYYIGEDISKAYTRLNGTNFHSTEYNGLMQAPDEQGITVETASSTLELYDANGEKRYGIAYYKDGFEKENLVEREDIVNAGTYYIAVVGVPSKGTYAKSDESNSCVYTINPRSIAPAYMLVSGYDGTYYYTGQQIQPKGIIVEDTDLPVTTNANDPQRRSVKLILGTDYELSYMNNVSAGKASIIVTGKGNYTGNRAAYFNIISSNAGGNNTWDGTSEGTGSISNGTTTIAASDIVLGYDNSAYDCMMYNGYERIPTVNIAGISNSEFIITASNNVRPGIATLTIIGNGHNFTGTIIKTYKIKANLAAYGNITAIPDQVYTGYQITPHVTATCGGNLLNQGSDYTVTYLNNTNVGKATVMINATSDSYYIGTATGYFNISNAAGGMEITGYGSAYTYTGYPITPDVVVTMNGRLLNRGTDYTVAYSNNTNVGTATMTVTGIGSFSGTKTIHYTIEAKNIENCLTTAVTSYQYTGNTYTPNVTVTDSSTGKTLIAGTDYTITYSNNTNPGNAKITVTALSKNYTGSKVIPFKIISAAVSGLRTSNVKNNSVKLSWSEQDYADGYQICNSSNRVVATTTNNSYTVKGLTSSTTYKFKVRSFVENSDGSVSYGNFSTAVSAKTMLNTPTLTAKSTSKGKVTLTWTKVAKATGYEIYYSTERNGIYKRLKTISKSSARKYVDAGLASGEKYYYTIRAYRVSNGVKTYSNYNTIRYVKVK